jgi:hypothetical protein
MIMVVLLVFLTIIALYIKGEAVFDKYSAPQAIKEWKKLQKERQKLEKREKYSINEKKDSEHRRKERRKRMIR